MRFNLTKSGWIGGHVSRAVLVCLALAGVGRADIFQWEYINPADPSQGKQQSSTLCPGGAGVDAVPNANLEWLDLTKAYLIGADLTNAGFSFATLTDADLTGAEVRDASFELTTPGFTKEQLYSTASYQAHDLYRISLESNNLTGWNFAGQNLTSVAFDNATLTGANLSQSNLTSADFNGAKLTGADLTGAVVRGARFRATVLLGFASGQLYSTASYQSLDLNEINLESNNLSGWNFAGQSLTGAKMNSATLTGADLTGADTRGAQSLNTSGAVVANLIQPNGHITGLGLNAGQQLRVRDYDVSVIPITVDQGLTMAAGSTLRMVFEADAWGSLISFAPGIPVTLGGALELTFAADVDLASQVGRTFDLFNWTGVTATGSFSVVSDYAWNLTNLYSTGEVTLLSVPTALPGDYNGNNFVDAADYTVWRDHLGSGTALLNDDTPGVGQDDYTRWVNNFGSIPGMGNANLMPVSVPEPTTFVLVWLAFVAGMATMRR